MNRSPDHRNFEIGSIICYKRNRGKRNPRGRIISLLDTPFILRKPSCDREHYWTDIACRTLLAVFLASRISACAGFGQSSPMPSCSNVRGYFEPDVPLGTKRVGSRLRVERRTVEIYFHAFGERLGNYGLERTIRMAALKYRGVPDTDWAICPVRW